MSWKGVLWRVLLMTLERLAPVLVNGVAAYIERFLKQKPKPELVAEARRLVREIELLNPDWEWLKKFAYVSDTLLVWTQEHNMRVERAVVNHVINGELLAIRQEQEAKRVV